MTSAEFLFALRMLGKTQAEFARWIDVNVTTVNRWARGKQPIPLSIERLLTLTKLNHDVMVDIDGEDAEPLVADSPFKLDDYQILGVSPDTPPQEIRRSYLNLMKRHHPDIGGSPETAARISAAYESIMQAQCIARASGPSHAARF